MKEKKARGRGNRRERMREKEGEEGEIGPSSFPFTGSLGELIY